MSNCNDCRWHWSFDCASQRDNGGCYDCPNFNSDLLECKCSEYLTNDEVDCPMYEKFDGGSNYVL